MSHAFSTGAERTVDRVVAIATSAGGLKALTTLLETLPADFPAPLLIVQHLGPDHRSLLPEILARRCRIPVVEAHSDERVQRGTAYIAPPDRHLLITSDGTISLTHTETVHFVRPSADLLFTSVAEAFGPGAIAVVLTGTGVDGSDGIRAIKEHGGYVLVQDEESSEYFGMPGSALRTGCVDRVLPLSHISEALIALLQTGIVK